MKAGDAIHNYACHSQELCILSPEVDNLLGERHFIGRLARSLAERGLAEMRRTSPGMQLRLTPAGEALAAQREREAAEALAGIDWIGIASGLSG